MGVGADRSDIRGAEASHGPCFGTNEHPRRDTDVILRQSKAPIEIFNFRWVYRQIYGQNDRL